jgi:hypothetical protein
MEFSNCTESWIPDEFGRGETAEPRSGEQRGKRGGGDGPDAWLCDEEERSLPKIGTEQARLVLHSSCLQNASADATPTLASELLIFGRKRKLCSQNSEKEEEEKLAASICAYFVRVPASRSLGRFVL